VLGNQEPTYKTFVNIYYIDQIRNNLNAKSV